MDVNKTRGGIQAPALVTSTPMPTPADIAHANEYFEYFLTATSLKNILGAYRSICDLLKLRPNQLPLFYPKLRQYLCSWKAKALWKRFDAKAQLKCYGKGKLCPGTRVLVVGGGPCGLRTAIEAQLLGAKVVVIEKRDRFSRNNVLHLWPFVIEDLRSLGAKKFFGKFCAGSIDHISIRQIQYILFKVCLLLGVELHTEVSFERLIEPDPDEKTGWRGEFVPSCHPVSQYQFDVVIGADGKRNTLQGFSRKEFRGKLAIAITANFINKKTEAEARVEEISGVAFIFNQKFFKDLYEQTGIDLENIVYYKDETHYFVMTAKKASLIEKGVIIQDLADTDRLLAPDNVNREALMSYAREAAEFSTKYQMHDLEFAVNHYGLADVAMFDFTSMYAAENASKVIERHGYRLLMMLVGDSLLEPFWPTGSGCARGFLSSMDAGWAIRSWASPNTTPLDVIAERESIYRLLAQTTPDNLNKDWKAYTIDPATRYPNLNKGLLVPQQVIAYYDTDDPRSIESMKRKDEEQVGEVPKKRRRANVDNEILLNWISDQIRGHENIQLSDIASVFRDGKVLCCIIHHYRPDLVDYNSVKDDSPIKNNQLALDVLEKEMGIPPIMTGEEITATSDFLSMATYLTQIYDVFRGEIPHIKHPKLELPDNKAAKLNILTRPLKPSTFAPQAQPVSRHKRAAPEQVAVAKTGGRDGRPRKRRTVGLEKSGVSVEERQKVLEEIAANRSERINKRRQQRKLQTEQFMKSMQMLQVNAKPDKSQPFEDYSIYLYRQNAPNFEDRVKDLQKQFIYIPDPEQKPPSMQHRGSVTDEDLAARIRSLEDKWRDPEPTERKPKDLMRAIGKIETSDWNIREIEKKIQENRSAKVGGKDREKVPKWSKEEFRARQNRMENKHLDRQDSREAKYADIDKNIKHLELKLKEGTSRDLGQNKVASITEKFVNKQPDEPKPIEKSNSKTVIMPQSTSDLCHFCDKRVYLMERLSAEGRFFHHSCFKCQYCHTQLKLGSYTFDREGLYGFKFYCVNHFGMQGEAPVTRVTHKPSGRGPRDIISPEKRQIQVTGVDLLDRVQTPERIEFANLSTGIPSSDQEESLSQMDEDEWTDKNFGASAAEFGSSDDESSSLSETESDDEDAYEEALDEPVTKEGTMKWAELLKKRYPKKRRNSNSDSSSTDHSSYYENSSDDDDSDTATEGEEEIRAREIRKQEVCVEPPVVQTDTGTDTEVVSEEETSSSSEIHNSATEISTDSEFAQDDPTPTREIPPILLNDFHVTKTRGSSSHQRERDPHVRKSRKSALQPKKIQVTSSFLQSPSSNGRTPKPDIELKLTPLVPSAPIIRKPALLPRTEGYALNRTQSTGGIAAKVSLELKKKYLLGETAVPGSIQKSGSSSVLDTKLKSFHSNISDCQKLLKPASEVSASMKTFCSKLDERVSPILSPQISSNTVLNKSDENIQPNRKPLPPPDIIKVETPVFENENHGRPRSPVHETSIIVPEIDWSKKKDQMSEDSLSESTSEMEDVKTPEFKYEPIPRVEIHPVEDLEENNDGEIKDDIPPDSLCFEAKTKPLQDDQHVSNNESPKSSINSDKKSLNQPKCLPAMQSESVFSEIHFSLHKKHKASNQNSEKQSLEDLTSVKNSSGRSTPSNADSCAEQMTAAFTETELSDWARDDDVSDDLECVEYELNEDKQKPSVNKKSKLPNVKSDVTLSDTGEHKDTKQVCDSKNGKDFKDLKNKTIITEAMNNLLSSNLDNIEFMDTGTETSSDDGIVDERNGYVLFNNEDDIMEDSLNPNINSIAETRNMRVYSKYDKPVNTGYCIFDIQDNFGSEVIELKPADLEKLRQKQNHLETEEDSLLIVEPGTTTEENTCSDSTVKILTNKRPTDANEEKLQPVNETVEHFKSTGLEEDNMGEKENVMKEEKTVEKEQVNQKRESNFQKQRLEEKLAKLKAEKATQKQNKELFSSSHKENLNETSNLEFQEHCQRLQSKIEFGNARDSIDIRKTRRKSKTEIQRPDLIQEEKEKSSPIHSSKDITLNLTPVIRPPNTFYKKECIEKERDVNQKLIQEMVMNKMRAENKSLERKKRNRSTPSPLKPFELTRSATADIVLQDSNTAGSINSASISAISSSLNKYATPDVLLSTNSVPLQKSQTSVSVSSFEKSASPIIKEQYTKPLSVYSSVSDRAYSDKSTELTHAKIHSNEYFTNAESFKTPSATSRQRIEGPKKTAEKLREDARARMRMLSNEELGLSPEDRLEKFREKMGIQKDKSNDQVFGLPENLEPLVIASEKRHSWLYSNDTLKKKKNNSFRRSKSGDDSDKKIFRQLSFLKSSDSLITEGKNQTPEKSEVRKMCKSDPNLLDTEEKKVKKKPKDRERKKSITTIISGLFTSKKSPSGSGSRRLFSRISPKSKDVSKSCADLATRDPEIVREEPVRRNSFSEVCSLKENKDIPPPIPPLPLNYVGYLLKDDGSDGEREWKYDRSSCDTLDQSAVLDCSSSSLNSRRTSKGARRARQAQLKRHRLAQEIQRKLEEAEVKTRALEERGVHVEKALRGEGGVKTSSIDETHLLQEWFDLMRDRTELRRYERELTVRAQELELEDRHARLQQELRERMENDAPKTSRDEETERHIINEMMDIVDKRDSLIAVLEEDRLRYSNEDRDFEEQMLAKGLRLTPIVKNP